SNLKGLTLLPSMSRADILANYREGITVRGMRPQVTWTTTGTTGRPLCIEWTRKMADVRVALALRRLLKFGILPWHRVVTIWPPKVQWRYSLDARGRRRISTAYLEMPLASAFGRPMPNTKVLISTPGDLVSEARALRDLKPDFIVSQPPHLDRLGEQMVLEGVGVNPRGLLITWEDTAPSLRNHLRRMYQTELCRLYGSTEAGNLGGDCRAQSGIHLCEDYLAVEVLKGEQQVGPGETGELVITSLHNDIMPLVRYRTGDLVELADGERCACGSSLMRVRSVLGRKGDGLLTVDGQRIPPLRTVELLQSSLGLRDFQIRQVSLDRLVVRLAGAQDPDGLKEALEELLGRAIGTKVSATFEQRDEDELWAKSRPVVSMAS
ncbi:MAG TPA: hypothetical protein VLY21_04245, partial [Nitrososphaerales archaeon]|nr:hypothetical protein [Nitrososphaerales archaeon]